MLHELKVSTRMPAHDLRSDSVRSLGYLLMKMRAEIAERADHCLGIGDGW
jgi:hypothetical protein